MKASYQTLQLRGGWLKADLFLRINSRDITCLKYFSHEGQDVQCSIYLYIVHVKHDNHYHIYRVQYIEHWTP